MSFSNASLPKGNIKKVTLNIHDDGEVRQNIHDGSFLYILVFRFYDNKLSNCPLSLADASHEFQIHVSVRILTIKFNQ